MELNSLTMGVFLLLVVSIIVRVLPSLVTLNISPKSQEDIRSILPSAVFINLIIYCLFQEIEKSLLPAVTATALMLLIFRKVGMIFSIIVGTAVYLSLGQYLMN